MSAEDTTIDGDKGGTGTTTEAHDPSSIVEPSAGPLGPIQMRKVRRIITTGVCLHYPLTKGSSPYSQALRKRRLTLSRIIRLLDGNAIVIPYNQQT